MSEDEFFIFLEVVAECPVCTNCKRTAIELLNILKIAQKYKGETCTKSN